MGVSQLLKHLKPCLTESHVENYRGKTVAIDGNTFIFRGCYSCSEQVATGQPCSRPVEYLMKRINMLRHYGVIPWVVLDGRRTPMKEDTNNGRREEREKNLRVAKDFRRQADEQSGAERDALMLKAEGFFQKSIHVTRQMVTNAMAAMKQEGIKCMVAPYEADAQVAFLVKRGLASAVITEDSDILVYLAAVKSTAPVLYKMDQFGKCQELGFDAHKLSSLPGVIGKFGRGLVAFGGDGGGRLFVQLAALAGCDYVDNVKGLGLITALPIISKFKCAEADGRVSHILMHLTKTGKTVPEGHRERMLRAELSFFWHRVYDPRSKTCVHFCSAAPELAGTSEVPALPTTAGGTDFLGEHIDDVLMENISRGKVDPTTGNTVTAETFATPSLGGGRRSMTKPSPTGSRRQVSASVRPKSASMPMATPRPAWSKEQHQGTGQISGGRLGPQRLLGKRPQGAARRGKETPRKQNSGVLKDMFERMRSQAERRENAPQGGGDANVGDVSDIVLACGEGRTPLRARVTTSRSSTVEATRNPFAKTTGLMASTARTSPSNLVTPAAFKGGSRPRSDVAHSIPQGYAGEATDAWSRLSKGCLATAREGKESAVTSEVVDVTPQREGHVDEEIHVVQSGYAVREAMPSVHDAVQPSGKRSFWALAREDKTASRGKKAKVGGGRKSQAPLLAGKAKTMLSFFGRASGSKP